MTIQLLTYYSSLENLRLLPLCLFSGTNCDFLCLAKSEIWYCHLKLARKKRMVPDLTFRNLSLPKYDD